VNGRLIGRVWKPGEMSASRVEGVETIVDSTVDYLIDTFTQPVGWVERSETHHVAAAF
jgi:hypothetical protein